MLISNPCAYVLYADEVRFSATQINWSSYWCWHSFVRLASGKRSYIIYVMASCVMSCACTYEYSMACVGIRVRFFTICGHLAWNLLMLPWQLYALWAFVINTRTGSKHVVAIIFYRRGLWSEPSCTHDCSVLKACKIDRVRPSIHHGPLLWPCLPTSRPAFLICSFPHVLMFRGRCEW